MSLRDLFNTPSSFEGDPGGFARNAAGHALIVGALPVLVAPALIPVFLIGYAIWEFAQWNARSAEVWDCVHDFAYVLGGAMAAFEPLVLPSLIMFYGADILRRAAR